MVRLPLLFPWCNAQAVYIKILIYQLEYQRDEHINAYIIIIHVHIFFCNEPAKWLLLLFTIEMHVDAYAFVVFLGFPYQRVFIQSGKSTFTQKIWVPHPPLI